MRALGIVHEDAKPPMSTKNQPSRGKRIGTTRSMSVLVRPLLLHELYAAPECSCTAGHHAGAMTGAGRYGAGGLDCWRAPFIGERVPACEPASAGRRGPARRAPWAGPADSENVVRSMAARPAASRRRDGAELAARGPRATSTRRRRPRRGGGFQLLPRRVPLLLAAGVERKIAVRELTKEFATANRRGRRRSANARERRER